MYQGENTGNIDIHPSLHKLPTTQKYDANDIINSGIANDPHGSRNIYMDNQYYTPQLFSLMESNYNLMALGTYRANRKVSESVKLLLDLKI